MKAKKMKSIVNKIVLIVVGSLVASFGITLAINAGFGGATLAILWQGLSKTLHISIGQASMAVALCMLIFVFFYDRKQIHIGTVIYQVVYSSMMDVFSKIVWYSPIKWVNILIMLAGIMVFSFGTGLYASADMGRGSYEALMFSINSHTGFQVKYIRMVLDVVMVIIGLILGGTIGLCTVATILLSGPLIQKTVGIVSKINTKKRGQMKN